MIRDPYRTLEAQYRLYYGGGEAKKTGDKQARESYLDHMETGIGAWTNFYRNWADEFKAKNAKEHQRDHMHFFSFESRSYFFFLISSVTAVPT